MPETIPMWQGSPGGSAAPPPWNAAAQSATAHVAVGRERWLCRRGTAPVCSREWWGSGLVPER
jgi:hypothetical protein